MSATRPHAPDPSATAVPVYLPLGFVAAGMAGFLLVVAELWGALPSSMEYVRHNARLLAVVHLFTLVWGSGVTLGVLHQMAPVILSAQLYSVRLGWATLALFVPGGFLLALSFRSFWLAGVIAGGILVLTGALLFLFNIVRTVAAARDGGAMRRYLVASLVCLIGTLAFGIAMAAALRVGAGYTLVKGLLLSHLFLGGSGWFAGIIIAVSYKLVPMFLLVHGHGESLANRLLAVLYAGVALGVLGSLLGHPGGALPGVFLVLAAVLLWAADVASMWRKRMRRPDVWLRQVPVAVASLALAALGASACAVWDTAGGAIPPRAMLAVGALFALGAVSAMIIAFLHKIVPFLVWYHRYSGAIGAGRAPAMKDLVNESIGKIAFPIYHAAAALVAVAAGLGWAVAARLAAAALAIACALLLYDLARLIVPVEGLRRRLRTKAQAPAG